MPRVALALLRLLALALGGALLAAAVADGGGLGPGRAWADKATRSDVVDEVFRGLSSPLQSAREGAEARLSDLLQGADGEFTRRRIAEALPSAPWTTQVVFAEVLARDGAPDSLRALLAHLAAAPQSQFALTAMSLVRDPAAGDQLLTSLRLNPDLFAPEGLGAQGQSRLNEFRRLIQRLEIEGIFVSRKSRSGGTGYYKGQYEELARDGRRELALEIVLAIALDEALPVPGQFTSGAYQFLRPLAAEIGELRGMAINAVAELATSDDTAVIDRLERRRLRLLQEWHERYEWLVENFDDYWMQDARAKAWEDKQMLWEDGVGEYADVVACLYSVAGSSYTRRVREFIERMERFEFDTSRPRPLMSRALKSSILIRVGWYEEAIAAYRSALRTTASSRVLAYYNMACAYANWSLLEDENGTGLGDARRDQALTALEQSVSLGWSDLDWMRQDRDLDPLRSSLRYRAVEQIVLKRLDLPPLPDLPPPPGPGDPDGD